MRRTKEELIFSNYYVWLEEKNRLQAKKKSGVKLTKEEKAVVRFCPSPGSPYKGDGRAAPLPTEKEKTKLGNIPTRDADFPIGGGAFTCSMLRKPCTDEDCMLFCHHERCPFHSIGYFRKRGVKF